VDPTCTAEGKYENVVYCSVCDAELKREAVKVPALGHTKGEPVVVTVDATCTTKGSVTTTINCSVCGEQLDHTVAIIPELGHAYGDWTYVDENNHKHVCGNDAAHVETEAHTFTDGVCECGAAKYTVTINGNGTVNGNTATYTVVYDSNTTTNPTLNLVPVIENGVSKSFVSSVSINGAEQALTYTNYCVELNVAQLAGEIVVTFADCGFV
jgi:hypothetical protein